MNCLVGEGEYVAGGEEREVFLNLFPGQIYNLDDQCKMHYGSKSFYCGGGIADQEMCHSISCFTGNACSFKHVALDGTSCSAGSWCVRGQCVTDSRAPRAPKHCTNGDYKLPWDSKLFCKDEVDRDPVNKCSRNDVKTYCCASCEGNRTKNGGCQDTTEECLSLEPRDCYNGYYAITCCKTCSALVQNPSDVNCLYGDKGVNCQELIPAVCHLSTQYCCQTCAAYSSSVTKAVSSATPATITIATTTTTTTTATTSPKKTTLLTTSSTTSSTIVPITIPFERNLRDIAQYVEVLGAPKTYESCRELIEYDPSLCHYVDVVKEACKASCRSFEDYCLNGDLNDVSNKFTCEQLLEYNSSSCLQNQVRSRCCKSCEDILRKSVKVDIVML